MRLTQLTCNYFKKYVEREIKKATGVEFWKPLQGWRRIGRKRWQYTEHRPWTDAAKDTNSAFHQYRREYLEPVRESKLFKGDRQSTIAQTRTQVKLTCHQDMAPSEIDILVV